MEILSQEVNNKYDWLIGCTIINVNTNDDDTLFSLEVIDVNKDKYILTSEHDCHHGIEYIQVDKLNPIGEFFLKG